MNLDANDHDAHTIVLHSLVKDMREVLGWLSVGIAALVVVSLLDVLGALSDHRWVAAAFHAVLTVVVAWAWFDVIRRGSKYRGPR